ncbi:MAG: AraC family transcriptional activator of pobA [Paraglaciecola sp.]|jgi:AraC family transcriptional activator of pobA
MVLILLQKLLIGIYRSAPSESAVHPGLSKPERKVAMFKALIEQHNQVHNQVGWYANRVGVSHAHLNQVCQKYSGRTALGLINGFLLDEAKRHVIFADLRIVAVPDHLGFSDSTYFNKLFKKHTGITPGKYRQHFRE